MERAYIGVQMGPLDARMATKLGVKDRNGVLVNDVVPGSPAAAAGVQELDVITAFDGQPVKSTRSLQEIVERSALGKPHTLTVFRDGDQVTLTITVKPLPSDLAKGGRQMKPEAESGAETFYSEEFGLEVRDKDSMAEDAYADFDGVVIDRPLWQLSVCEASERIAAGTLSPVDLVEACLGRIAAVDGAIHSFIHVAAEQARAAAREAEAEIRAGRRRGALHGIPYAVKDNYDAAGLPATAGSRVRLDHVPTQDAALVARLRAAGAILLGKLNTWEFGTGNGGEYFDLPFPTARNPWDTERFAGGSSTGAGTSVAAGTTLFALGSDTTGSVRLPAAATGTLGLIATSDVLDRSGILPNCYTLDKPGIFAWTARDAALIFGELTGKGPTAP
ncbi:MAG: amidase family protein, partial [Hyphomicrobiales bacterium]